MKRAFSVQKKLRH